MPLWWEREDLKYVDGRLTLAGRDVQSLAEASGTPAFFYSAERVKANAKRVLDALAATGLPHRLFYAMKANRFAPLLTYLKSTGLCGVDVLSPNELLHALGCGFEEADISYTATSVSDEDLAIIARHRDILVNVDSISTIRRLARLAPGRRIGIRVNPAIGVGYGTNEILKYSGARTTKFGIYREQWDDALAAAKAGKLEVERIHFHTGCGYLTEQLPVWDSILEACTWFVDRTPGCNAVNMGGGMGVPHVATDKRIDYSAWGNVIKKHFGTRGVEVSVEPGDHIVKDACVLVLQVNTVERKKATDFVGVNGGFNIACEPVYYGLPCEPTPCRVQGDAFRAENLRHYTIAGNINEAMDIWYHDFPLPEVKEGDYLALLNSGGYSTAMASNHCMRGGYYERMLR